MVRWAARLSGCFRAHLTALGLVGVGRRGTGIPRGLVVLSEGLDGASQIHTLRELGCGRPAASGWRSWGASKGAGQGAGKAASTLHPWGSGTPPRGGPFSVRPDRPQCWDRRSEENRAPAFLQRHPGKDHQRSWPGGGMAPQGAVEGSLEGGRLPRGRREQRWGERNHARRVRLMWAINPRSRALWGPGGI